MRDLTTTEIAYLLWLDTGRPGLNRKLPPRLIERGLVEVIDDEPSLTWDGTQQAMKLRDNDDHGGDAA